MTSDAAPYDAGPGTGVPAGSGAGEGAETRAGDGAEVHANHGETDAGDHEDGELWGDVRPESARRLLLAALDSFAARGFHATTTRDIASRAGMSPAALYVHYSTKEDLLFQISLSAHQAAFAAFSSASASSDVPGERLRAAVRAFVVLHARHHTAARIAQYELAALRPAHYRDIVALRRAIEQGLRDVLECGVATGEFDVDDIPGTALAILSLSIDVARWYKPDSRLGPEDVAELYAGLVSRMVGKQG